MKRYAAFIAILTFSTWSCVDTFSELEDEAQAKRYEVFNFSTNKTTFSTEWQSCDIQDFDISPTARIDSIIFEAGLRSQFDYEHCIARLYNYSEDKPVIGSVVVSRFRYVVHTVSSGDINQDFPKGPVRIGAQFRSTREGHFAGLTTLRIIVFYSQD